jgi:hypothetical protein
MIAEEAGRLMAAMMGDVMRAMKQLPCVSIAAIDGALLINIAHMFPSSSNPSKC